MRPLDQLRFVLSGERRGEDQAQARDGQQDAVQPGRQSRHLFRAQLLLAQIRRPMVPLGEDCRPLSWTRA